jgi:hypothetical protein
LELLFHLGAEEEGVRTKYDKIINVSKDP